MAKRQKTTRFSIQTYDAAHYKQTEQYTKAVEALFDRATAEISRAAAKGSYNADKPFSFEDYPSTKSVLQNVTKQLATKVTAVIESGSKKQWLFACKKNDEFISSIMDTSKISKSRLSKMQDRNLDALQTFQQRKVEGMDLSQRVWKYVGQYKDQLEQALDVGLGEGRSADQLSRDVRQSLKDPNRLFRRVRDKRGNLVLSKNAKAFHPGQGVYRSSYKNAMRLTRSEINMAYRESDYARWQALDFVVGFEVRRANGEASFKCDTCEKLKGRYPKTFKFKGWHPQCMCYAVPILMDDEEFNKQELSDLRSALYGTEYKKLQSKNLVTDVPDNFKQWVQDHVDAQENWSSTPYFIKDNFKDGKLSSGLKIALPTVQPQVDVLAPYRVQIEQARRMATKWGLSVQLNMLNKYVGDKDVANIQSRIATIQSKATEMERMDADIRRKCAEWGLSTYILDEAMQNPVANNILAKINELEDRVKNVEKERNAFIAEANEAIKEARKLKIDVTEMLNWVAAVSDKREWIPGKARARQVLQDLLGKIQGAKAVGSTKLSKAEENEIVEKDSVFLNSATPEQKAAMSCKNHKELEDYMTTNGFVSKCELSTMSIDDARMVCGTVLRFVQEWGLDKIRLSMARMGTGVLAHANGGLLEINPSFFNKKNSPLKTAETYENCAYGWLERKKENLAHWKTLADNCRKNIADYEAKGDFVAAKSVKYSLNQLEKFIKQAEAELNAGHTRHNVFFSEKSVLRTTVQHELGHVVHDQLLGAINGRRFLKSTLTTSQYIEMNNDWNKLFAKYQHNCGWLSTYGATNAKEFLSESMVLYMERGGKGLPDDVKAWFDKFKSYSKGTK